MWKNQTKLQALQNDKKFFNITFRLRPGLAPDAPRVYDPVFSDPTYEAFFHAYTGGDATGASTIRDLFYRRLNPHIPKDPHRKVAEAQQLKIRERIRNYLSHRKYFY